VSVVHDVADMHARLAILDREGATVDRRVLEFLGHRRDEVRDPDREWARRIVGRKFGIATPRVVALGVVDVLLAEPDQSPFGDHCWSGRRHAGIVAISSAARCKMCTWFLWVRRRSASVRWNQPTSSNS